jgi:hypothetical protein
MLYFISVWTLLLIGCCGCGLGLLDLLEINIRRQDCPVVTIDFQIQRRYQRAMIATWLGMLAISIVLLATALFLPLSPAIGCIVLIFFLLISLRSSRSRSDLLARYRCISRTQIVMYLGIAIAIAALFSQPVRWYDSGLYHYSLLRWLTNFGTVPGIALLLPNLGFTSAWFAFSAPLNPDWSIEWAGATANGFVFLLAALHLAICIGRLIRRQGRLDDWFIAVYYSCLLLFMTTIRIGVMADVLISPSPDIPAVLLVAMVAWTMLLVETDPPPDRFALDRQIVPLLLAMGAISIKLTALPLLFVTGLWFVVRAGCDRQIIQRMGIVAAASLLLIPLLVSNLVTSGCPLYPSTTFCFDLPWTVGTDRSISNATHQWISWYGKPPAGVHPWLWAFQLWLKNAGNQAILATIALSAGCTIYWLKNRLSAKIAWRGSLWLLALAFVGIGFFLLTSPLKRFMLPYLLLVPALVLATYCHDRFSTELANAKLPIDRSKSISLCLVSILTVAVAIQVRPNYSMLILPRSIDRVTTIKRQINDVTYFSPVGGQEIGSKDIGCWTNEFPCAYNPDPIVRLRNPAQGIRAGFIRT